MQQLISLNLMAGSNQTNTETDRLLAIGSHPESCKLLGGSTASMLCVIALTHLNSYSPSSGRLQKGHKGTVETNGGDRRRKDITLLCPVQSPDLIPSPTTHTH